MRLTRSQLIAAASQSRSLSTSFDMIAKLASASPIQEDARTLEGGSASSFIKALHILSFKRIIVNMDERCSIM
eukprot:scaffold137325_cov16-Tisochrysis_lutea.AAC.3